MDLAQATWLRSATMTKMTEHQTNDVSNIEARPNLPLHLDRSFWLCAFHARKAKLSNTGTAK